MGADGTELMVLIGVGRSGVDRFQRRRLVLAAVGAENRNSNAGHRVL